MKSTKPKRPTKPKPTNAQKVARRLQCLYILVLRGWADVAANKKYKDAQSPYSKWNPAKLNELITAAAARPELRSAFTAREKKILSTNLGKLPGYVISECTHRSEGLAVLAWALGQGENLYPTGIYGDYAYKQLDPTRDLSTTPSDFLAKPKLRPRAQLRRQQTLEHEWTWRVRMEVLQLTIGLSDAAGDERADEAKAILDKAITNRANACAAKGLVKLVKGDFPIGDPGEKQEPFGVAFERAMDPRTSAECPANERFRAINWAIDPTQKWHNTQTQTPLGFTMPQWMIGSSRFLSGFLHPSPSDKAWYR